MHKHSPVALRYVAEILYEIMLDGFLCLTKPSKRAVRGAVLLTPCVHAGVFLRLMGIISTVSKQLRYSRLGRVRVTPVPWAYALTLWRDNEYCGNTSGLGVTGIVFDGYCSHLTV